MDKWVIDWKTSKDIYSDYPPQVAAYKHALGYDAKTGIARFGKDGAFQFKDTTKTYEKDLEEFTLCLKLFYLRHPVISKKAGVA